MKYVNMTGADRERILRLRDWIRFLAKQGRPETLTPSEFNDLAKAMSKLLAMASEPGSLPFGKKGRAPALPLPNGECGEG